MQWTSVTTNDYIATFKLPGELNERSRAVAGSSWQDTEFSKQLRPRWSREEPNSSISSCVPAKGHLAEAGDSPALEVPRCIKNDAQHGHLPSPRRAAAQGGSGHERWLYARSQSKKRECSLRSEQVALRPREQPFVTPKETG